MRTTLIMILAVACNACSIPSAIVRSQAVAYDDAIEDTTNKLLVLNILRAKDKAPQHFDEIPSIHESITATASYSATYPFGPRPPTSPGRNSFTPGFNVQMSPSFEVDHLDTKDFVTGLASPIDPKFVKYWLDRGLDRRIVLLLFFSAVDISGTNRRGEAKTIRIRNSPREAIDALLDSDVSGRKDCLSQSDFQHYLRFINTLTTFSAHSYVEYRLLAEGLTLSPTADVRTEGAIKDVSELAAMDSTKYQWYRDPAKNTYSIYSVSPEPRIALCDGGYEVATGSAPLARQEQKDGCPTSSRRTRGDSVDPMAEASATDTVTFQNVGRMSHDAENFCEVFDDVVVKKENFLTAVEKSAANQQAPVAPGATKGLRFEMRSVGEIIQFLGDLLQFQETLEENHKVHPTAVSSLNRTLTFGYCPEESDRPGCGDVFFDLRHDSCNVRFSLTYRGRKYSVPNYNAPRDESCRTDEAPASGPPPKNHTLEVLAVVNQLIDLQKSAKDIRETPYIQVLP